MRKISHGISHGMSHSRLYKRWEGMKSRCNNPNATMYKYYGGRGIKVCDCWLNSFENFWEDMKKGYADNLTLDRINNNGNYELSNCHWTTAKEQGNNKVNCRLITYKGVTKTLSQWADIMGMTGPAIKARLGHLKWNLEDTFTIKKRGKTNISYKGETKTQRAWAKDLGITFGRLNKRIHELHWPLDKAVSIPKWGRLVK